MDHFSKSVSNNPEEAFPATAAKFARAAIDIQQMWQDVTETMPGVTSEMVKSILEKKNGAFDYSVYSENRRLIEMNDGSPAVEYDMKRTHPYGKHSRVSKKGVPYLIINFRWRSNATTDKLAHTQFFNSAIPQKIYNTNVKKLDKSIITTKHGHTEPNARGEMIERWEYNWIKSSRLSDLDAWSDRSKGLVRIKDDFASTYWTFRIISAKSPASSWIYRKKAKPGAKFMDSIAAAAKIVAEERVKEGLEEDLNREFN